MNKKTGEKIDSEIEHIKQSIADILLTAKGSRIMRRTYGSNVFLLIDRPISAAFALNLSCACVMAIKRWEPRIEVNRFAINVVSLNPVKVVGTIEATIKRNNKKITLTDMSINL
ncbi:GPW/gp25 family protein [Actinobacillus equuli subsp. equuli]|uniref:GPW/gp25 family protein n=1 Tax=Actinobacillus equuli subsp. equuli TaxID=202947 RepID=A0A9X4G2K2_ACTEU|nr:GPW/gp25 family protein [Actinobacillus equuli]MDE8034642.1 GPW/gp25 family protein [Actinobacillus equuli subsp. equuli]